MFARPLPSAPVLFAVALLAAGLSVPPAAAQNTGALATKAERLQAEYVRGAIDLAGEFERAGDPNAAISLLQGVRKVVPDAPGLEAKLSDLEERVLSAGETTLNVDAPTDWTPVAQVRKGGVFRLAASGTYRLNMAGTAGVEGLPPGDAAAGLVKDAPLGALIGAYVDPAAAARGGRKKDLPKVFEVGAGGGQQRTADETGVLMVRLNLPVGARASGKLQIVLSGQVAALDRR